MPRFLVAIHLPDDFDPAADSDDATARDIDALNEEMIAAGVRLFVGGLKAPKTAKSLRTGPDGGVVATDGPTMNGDEHVGGFWVLEAADMEAALAWGRKAVVACRAPVEVRQFH